MKALRHFFAFTTLEMIVVIGLIVTLSTVLFNSVGNHLAKARDAKRKGDVKAIQVAIEEYEKDNNCYPAPSLVTCTPLDTGLDPYLNKIPCDPKTGASYDYDNSGGTCPSWYRLFTNLENDKDLSRASCSPNCGPLRASDFYLFSPNAPQALAVAPSAPT
ncbi:MAG: type II secretion system protein, partial [Patescibacteria group bacterium]